MTIFKAFPVILCLRAFSNPRTRRYQISSRPGYRFTVHLLSYGSIHAPTPKKGPDHKWTFVRTFLPLTILVSSRRHRPHIPPWCLRYKRSTYFQGVSMLSMHIMDLQHLVFGLKKTRQVRRTHTGVFTEAHRCI